MGYLYGQGPYFSPPVNAADFTTLMSKLPENHELY